jgi:hypothetical protein
MSKDDQNPTDTPQEPSYWQRWRERLRSMSSALKQHWQRWRKRPRSMSSQRLEQELSVFEVKLEGLIAEREKKGGANFPHEWNIHSKECVKLAKRALEDGNPDLGWHFLNAARRFRLYGLRRKDLKFEATLVLEEAKDQRKGVTPWRKEGILHLLADDQGNPKPNPDAEMVVEAAELLHEHHSNTYRKQAIVRRRLWLLCGFSVVALIAWIALAPRLPSLSQWTAGRCWRGLRLFWLSLVLAGVVGAILSGFTSTIGKGVAKTRIPDELLASVMTFSRLAVGAVSAVAVAVFLGSGVLSFEALSYELLLAIALVSGFTDRLLVRAVESAVNAV